jgi:hypothetical protein
VKVKWFLTTLVAYIELEEIYTLIYEGAAAVRFRIDARAITLVAEHLCVEL